MYRGAIQRRPAYQERDVPHGPGARPLRRAGPADPRQPERRPETRLRHHDRRGSRHREAPRPGHAVRSARATRGARVHRSLDARRPAPALSADRARLDGPVGAAAATRGLRRAGVASPRRRASLTGTIVIALLLRLYPAAWRRRYGDEFAAVLEERPLGPFDVADVLLGALDSHLHRRGLWTESGPRTAPAMTLRIGGLAAIVFGLVWAIGLGWASARDTDDDTIPIALSLIGDISLIVAIVGLSAFQARHHHRMIWAAVVLPVAGAA